MEEVTIINQPKAALKLDAIQYDECAAEGNNHQSAESGIETIGIREAQSLRQGNNHQSAESGIETLVQ